MMKIIDLAVEPNRGTAETRVPKHDYKVTIITSGIIAAAAAVTWIIATATILAWIVAATAVVAWIIATATTLAWIVAATAVVSRIKAPPAGIARVGSTACPATDRWSGLRFCATTET